jgi:hypothetical protein
LEFLCLHLDSNSKSDSLNPCGGLERYQSNVALCKSCRVAAPWWSLRLEDRGFGIRQVWFRFCRLRKKSKVPRRIVKYIPPRLKPA